MVRYAGKSDIGRSRAHNEDAFCIVGGVNGLPLVVAVADGMGGHKAGDIASGMAVEAVSASIMAEPIEDGGYDAVASRLARIIDEANEVIYRRSLADIECSGMGTTLIIAAAFDKSLVIAHIGDSCAYHCRADALQKVTTDHTYVEELVRLGTLTREEALTHPRRNYITKVVGCTSKVSADFYNVGLEPGDRVMLCTDGLSKMLRDSEILAAVYASDDPDTICASLIEQANQRGGYDNITALALIVGE